MIRQIRINFQLMPEGESESAKDIIDITNYAKLTSIISDLNNNAENYCMVVQITNADSLIDNISFAKRLESLTQKLTKRELQVFHLAVNGLSNRLIAAKLFITIETVKSHRKQIVSKAGVMNMEEIRTWLLKTKV